MQIYQTEIRAARQREGLEKAKQKGIKFGSKRKLTFEQVAELKKSRDPGELIRVLMQDYRLSKSSIYRYLTSTTT
jgi:DNA invertase Pin-like site-specific DNA recombinase